MLGAMMLVTTFLVVLLVPLLRVLYDAVSYYWLKPRSIRKFMERQGVYGPDSKTLAGNIPEMTAMRSEAIANDMQSVNHDIVGRLLPHYVAWSKQYGKRFIFWNGAEPRLCLTETEMIREVLTKFNDVTGRSWMQQQGSKHITGYGLLMSNGASWQHQRRLTTPFFTGDRLKGYAGEMIECTKRMLESLSEQVKTEQDEVEIEEYFTRLTADIISRTQFGSSYEKGQQVFRLLEDLQPLVAQSGRHLLYPGSRFFPSKYNREIKSIKKRTENLLLEIIDSRKEQAAAGGWSSFGGDLLGQLLDEMQRGQNSRRPGDFRVDVNLVMDECKTFFFAGHETTAHLLTWAVMLLADNPMWQDRVRRQVAEVCRGETVTVDHLPKLTVLNMVINETLRLYPSATIFPRMAFEDIQLGDLKIPKGLSIWVPVLAMHHSEELWGKDANEFNPERFETRTFAPGRHFIPFSYGPRNCIGQGFAMLEAKLILAMFLSRFSFTLSENYKHAPVLVLTVKPKHGVRIHLKPLV